MLDTHRCAIAFRERSFPDADVWIDFSWHAVVTRRQSVRTHAEDEKQKGVVPGLNQVNNFGQFFFLVPKSTGQPDVRLLGVLGLIIAPQSGCAWCILLGVISFMNLSSLEAALGQHCCDHAMNYLWGRQTDRLFAVQWPPKAITEHGEPKPEDDPKNYEVVTG